MTDHENPNWTKDDFAQASGPESLSAAELEAFPRTAARIGRPRLASTKTPVKLRLDPDIVAAFKAEGPGWQTRINAALRDALAKRRA
ncbi:MAG: BrnA antitoxin family protein [Caulobacteraceae bacterium]